MTQQDSQPSLVRVLTIKDMLMSLINDGLLDDYVDDTGTSLTLQ